MFVSTYLPTYLPTYVFYSRHFDLSLVQMICFYSHHYPHYIELSWRFDVLNFRTIKKKKIIIKDYNSVTVLTSIILYLLQNMNIPKTYRPINML